MAEVAGLTGALPFPQCGSGQGCSRVVKIGAAVGALFVVIGITFAAVPAIPSIASSAFLGIGTPLLTISLIGALCQTNALQPATKWKVALVVSLILFGGGIALVATTAGAPAALGTVMLTVGSSTLLTTIIGGLSSQCHAPEPDQGGDPRPIGPGHRLGRRGRRAPQPQPRQDTVAQQAEAARLDREQERTARNRFLALSVEDQVRACVGARELTYDQVINSLSTELVPQLFAAHTTQTEAVYSGHYANDPDRRFVCWFTRGDPNHLYIFNQNTGQSVWVYTRNNRTHEVLPYNQIAQVSLNRTEAEG